mmetsp:Transcript_20762/g.48296  ORF Transcript_20762/g.48296 Transcript_20762/m.48296 type:complete len:207 (-) Transcript_20762:372-992(-)
MKPARATTVLRTTTSLRHGVARLARGNVEVLRLRGRGHQRLLHLLEGRQLLLGVLKLHPPVVDLALKTHTEPHELAEVHAPETHVDHGPTRDAAALADGLQPQALLTEVPAVEAERLCHGQRGLAQWWGVLLHRAVAQHQLHEVALLVLHGQEDALAPVHLFIAVHAPRAAAGLRGIFKHPALHAPRVRSKATDLQQRPEAVVLCR